MSWPARSALPRRRFHSGNRRCVTVQYSNGFLSSARFSANTAPRQASTIAITCAHWISCKDVGMKFHWGGFLVKLLNVDLMSHPFASVFAGFKSTSIQLVVSDYLFIHLFNISMTTLIEAQPFMNFRTFPHFITLFTHLRFRSSTG